MFIFQFFLFKNYAHVTVVLKAFHWSGHAVNDESSKYMFSMYVYALHIYLYAANSFAHHQNDLYLYLKTNWSSFTLKCIIRETKK